MPFFSSSSFSFSSSVSVNGKTDSQRYATQTHITPDGKTVKTASHRSGEPIYTETRQYDSAGRPIVDGRVLGSGQPTQVGRIEDVPDRQRGSPTGISHRQVMSRQK